MADDRIRRVRAADLCQPTNPMLRLIDRHGKYVGSVACDLTPVPRVLVLRCGDADRHFVRQANGLYVEAESYEMNESDLVKMRMAHRPRPKL